MGGIYSARSVKETLAPALANRCEEDQVDLVLLVPVWPVCHQSVGLIAREIESRGIPTLSLTSALSITRSVNPPRAAFLDFPLGHTAGKPNQKDQQELILERALSAFTRLSAPGSVLMMPETWDTDDNWKEKVMTPAKKDDHSQSADNRTERLGTPQYQCELEILVH